MWWSAGVFGISLFLVPFDFFLTRNTIKYVKYILTKWDLTTE